MIIDFVKIIEVHRRLLQEKSQYPDLGMLFRDTISRSDAEAVMLSCVVDVLNAVVGDMYKRDSDLSSLRSTLSAKDKQGIDLQRGELLWSIERIQDAYKLIK